MDREIQLAMRGYVGAKKTVETYSIEIRAVDASKQFAITAVGNPVARLDSLSCRDQTTNNNYDIIAGQVPQAAPGDVINTITNFTNVGTIAGNLFSKATDLDTGIVLYNNAYAAAPNYQVKVAELLGSMPAHNWRILIEIGH